MNIQKLRKILLGENDRSPFTLSVLEMIVAIVVGIFTWSNFRLNLSTMQVFYSSIEMASEEWIPLMGIATLSAISLVRVIRNDIRGFSRIGHVALAWSLFSVPLLGFLSIFFWLIGIILALLAATNSFLNEDNKGNLLAAFVSVVWVVFGFMVSARIEHIIWD